MAEDSLDALNARVDTLEGQVKEIFDRLNDPRIGTAVLASKMDNVLVAIGEIKQSIESLKGRPSRLWDALITGGMSAIIASIVGLIVAHVH